MTNKRGNPVDPRHAALIAHGNLELPLEFDAGGRPACSKCGNPVYATGGPHMDLCENCLWDLIDHEQMNQGNKSV
jgi:hypothetical protein